MNNIPVSVLVPVKNEEKNLGKSLPLLQDFDEVIVIDSSSTDRTQKICEHYKNVTYENFIWNGKYPKKRNWALENLTIKHEWVLFLDADELVTPAVIYELQNSIQQNRYDGFWISYTNHFMGKRLRFGDNMKKLALFKKDIGRYEKIEEDYWSNLDMEIHEHPIINGETGELKEPIIHNDFKSLSHYIQKHNEYSDWEAHRFIHLSENGNKSLTIRQKVKYQLLDSPFLSPLYFIYCFIIRLGFLDGKVGYWFAKYKAGYFFQIYTKIREYEAHHRE